jgi:hypothetical protein
MIGLHSDFLFPLPYQCGRYEFDWRKEVHLGVGGGGGPSTEWSLNRIFFHEFEVHKTGDQETRVENLMWVSSW